MGTNAERNLRAKQEFLVTVKEIHPLLDFSDSVYINASTKVRVRCLKHGEFFKYPNDLKNGVGCPTCSKQKSGKQHMLKPLSFFLKELPDLDYITELDNNTLVQKSTKVLFKCEKHGEQSVTIDDLVRGKLCPLCRRSLSNCRKALTKAQAESLVPKSKKHLKICFPDTVFKSTCLQAECTLHGVSFKTTLGQIIEQKYSCPVCSHKGVAKSHKYTKEYYITLAKRVHGDKYDYSRVNYVDSHTEVEILCPLHGSFFQALTYHVNDRQGCPVCAVSKQESKWEKDIAAFIESKGFEIVRNYRQWCGQKEIDIYIPSLRLGFELNGAYYHCVSDRLGAKTPMYHKEKSEQAFKQGISLVHLWDTADLRKNLDIVVSKLGLNKKLYARKACVRKVPQKEANAFYDVNHLKGSVGAGFTYGLYIKDELVAAMSFRAISKTSVELSRYANLREHQVIGGFSRLLRAFEKENIRFCKIVSFAYRDICPDPYKSVYAKTGFTLLPGCSPMLFYYDKRTGQAVNRQRLMKYKLAKMWEDFDPCLTEKENCERHDLYQCFDSGIWKFEKSIQTSLSL